jgi:hypothetical protein
MELEMVQMCEKYLQSIDSIRKRELIAITELVKQLGITYITLRRIKQDPSTCSLKTLKKFRTFVERFNTED